MKKYIDKLIVGQNLSRQEAYDLFVQFETINIEQKSAIIALLAAKKESVEELLGARDFLLKQTSPIICDYDVVDIVGTGGDGIGTFNISTAASIVVASCGAYVAKHGGRSATSASGSTDVIESLGINLHDSAAKITDSLSQNHYAYIWAPLFNPILKTYGSLRKNLGFPTIFNILGPLINPTYPKRQAIGVYRKDLVAKLAIIFKNDGSKHSLIMHSADGLDEISVSAATYITEVKNGAIKEYKITPRDFGLAMSSLDEAFGGLANQNAKIINGIFAGEILGAKLDIVLLNAAAGLVVAGIASDLYHGVEIARNAILSGKALALLTKLRLNKS